MARPNVVLVVMDTARADAVGVGEEDTPMPWLSEFAGEGTTHTSARANAPWTLPSHGTLFSGHHPSTHGAHAGHKSFDYEPTLASLLSESGYRTVGVSNNTWVSGEFGFDRGFDEFLSTWQLYQTSVDFGGIARRRSGALDTLKGLISEFRGNPVKNALNIVYGRFLRKRYDDGARRTNRLIEDRLAEWLTESPLFLFVNYLEPHLEYRPPEEFARRELPDGVTLSEAREVNQDAWAFITGAERMSDRDFEILRGLYRAELAYLDTRLRELYELFEDIGVADDTVFIVTGDHGENLGEHRLMDHQYSLHETLLRVPLVVNGGRFDAGVTDTPVQMIDILPTVLDIAGIERPSGLPGTPLDEPPADSERRTFAEYLAPQPAIETIRERYECRNDVDRFDRALRAVVTGDRKYVRGTDGGEWFFDLHGNPSEMEGDTDGTIDKEELRSILDGWERSQPDLQQGETSMRDETRARLEDLGYLQ
jgi:arylsulfatase A-like enzyme